MSSIFMCRLLPTGLLLGAFAVQAQPAVDMSPVSPSPAMSAGRSPVPPSPTTPAGASPEATGLAYLSAFTNYRAWSEQPVASWQDANRTVGRLGGWRAYARQAQQPETAGEGAGVSVPGPQPHADHAGHGAQP